MIETVRMSLDLVRNGADSCCDGISPFGQEATGLAENGYVSLRVRESLF